MVASSKRVGSEYNAPDRKSNPARVRFCRVSASLLSLRMEPLPGFLLPIM